MCPVCGGPLGHGLDVAAGAERTLSPGKHHAADGIVGLDVAQDPVHGRHHGLGHGVSPARAVHREDRDAVVDLGQQIFGSGIELLPHAGPPPGAPAAETNRTPATVTGGTACPVVSLTSAMASPRPGAAATNRRSCRACSSAMTAAPPPAVVVVAAARPSTSAQRAAAPAGSV